MFLTVSLNASIDKAYFLDNPPKIDEVNRVPKVLNTAGGKGINVARAISECGDKAIATGFAGGHNGRYFCDMLDTDNINHDFVLIKNETRSCINVLYDGRSTEFLENGAKVEKQDLNNFKVKFTDLLDVVDAVIISGSAPTGTPVSYYSELIEIAKNKQKLAYLDTSGKSLECAIKTTPHFIKPNKYEAEELCGIKIDSIEKSICACKELVKTGIDIVVISLGSKGAVVADSDSAYYSLIELPDEYTINNTVGCGDTFVGAFAVCDMKDYSIKESLEFALAASKSNALSDKTGYCEIEQVKEFLKYAHTEKF